MNKSQELGHPLASLGINQLRDENKQLRTQRDELLKALKGLLAGMFDGPDESDAAALVAKARAAIAKAEGGAA